MDDGDLGTVNFVNDTFKIQENDTCAVHGDGKDSCSTTATYTVTRTGRSSSSQNLTVFWRTRSFDDLPLVYTASDLDIKKVTNGSISFIGDDQTGATGNSLTFTVDVYNDDHFEYPDEMFGVELYVQYVQYALCTT